MIYLKNITRWVAPTMLLSALILSACWDARSAPPAPPPDTNAPSPRPVELKHVPAPYGVTYVTAEAAISGYVVSNLEAYAEPTITLTNTEGDWRFICGEVVLVDAGSDDAVRNFCTLIDGRDAEFVVKEFELIGSDAPWYDWIEKHGFPERILK